jgi:hypothetical protein|nr:hypothetical protein [uncultured Romboutsia sp.]
MENLDWGAISGISSIVFGVIATIGVIATVIQVFKKDKDTNNNSVNQNIKGLFFFGNDISQDINKSKEDNK